MAVHESSFTYTEIKTKIGSTGALWATQHPTKKLHHQISLISEVFVASNDSPADGSLSTFRKYIFTSKTIDANHLLFSCSDSLILMVFMVSSSVLILITKISSVKMLYLMKVEANKG
jgi:hypothetical protein